MGSGTGKYGGMASWLLTTILTGLAASASAAQAESPAALFERAVRPILEDRCAKCHSGAEPQGGLHLTTAVGIRQGGDSGAAVVAGRPDDSLLYQLVRDRQMPPADKGEKPLSEAQVEAIRAWIAGGADTPPDRPHTLTQHDVLPILWLRCTVCHGTRVREGDLDLRTRESMLKGGKSGPAIVPGQPGDSLLLKRIHADEMPPRRRVVEVSIKPIEADEVAKLEQWIAAGAPLSDESPDLATIDGDPLVSDADRQFWAFQSPRRSPLPAVRDPSRIRTPIDTFIVSQLEQQGLELSPEAERAVLLRRLFVDLTGLPPTPEEARQFLDDDDPLAYERLVDRLVASPRYGERWARYWLDLAGYSDSNGVQHADPIRPQAWRYRDYVIRAFNADKPYDRFLLEQIAGDELADYRDPAQITPEIYDNLVATGFLRMTPDGTSANITNFVPDRLEIIADELHVLSSTVLGLTIKCARCHTHKTDPIPHRDYYRLAAVFKGAYDEHDWLKATKKEDGRGPWGERNLDVALPAELQAWQTLEQEIQTAVNAARERLQARRTERTAQLVAERLAALPEVLRDDLQKMLATPAEQRTDIQKYLAEKFEKSLTISDDELKKLDAEYKQLADETDRTVKQQEGRRGTKPYVHALWDRGEPSPTYILQRGDYTKPGREVGPGVISVLTNGRTPLVVEPPWPGAPSTGRRLAFAKWLVEPQHPLTARVMVNRIWRHHFGAGLVRTLDNFGVTGEPPTHPELLDWLAREFVESGWSVKHLHRLMVTSAVYRQSSSSSSEREARDPENKWMSRMPLRRLEAEALRDSLLAVAGRLDLRAYGPADDVSAASSGLVTVSGNEPGRRRTIYVLQRRTQTLTLLEDFDLPAMLPNCTDRPISTVAPQALHLMNNAGVHELAVSFAERVRESAGAEPRDRIAAAWWLAYARGPSDEETELALAALDDLTRDWLQRTEAGETASTAKAAADKALVNLCHALLNSAEFLTID